MIVQNLIFAMSLSGSVVVLLYILTCPLAKRCFPLKWRYLVLKLAVMFYLIPFPYGICKAVNWLRSVNPLVWKIFPDPFYQSPELAKQMVKSAVTLDPSGKIFLSRDLIPGQ